MTAKRLLTADQVCDQFGIPSPRTVRTMRQQGLAAVRLGKAYLFDPSDVESFIEARKERTCHGQIEAPSFIGTRSGEPSTSSGMRAEGGAFGQLARQTANRLKQPLPASSAQVIDLEAHASRKT